MTDTLRSLFTRELTTLRRETEAYPDDSSLWQAHPGLPNPGGTLVLHLCGNLRHFIGTVLGETGYVRDRPAEFAGTELSRSQLVAEIDDTLEMLTKTLEGMPVERLEADYPLEFDGKTFRTATVLLHLLSHLSYHLGQLDYHRRLTTGDAAGVGAVAIAELRR